MSGCLAEKNGFPCGGKNLRRAFTEESILTHFGSSPSALSFEKGASSSTLTQNPDEVFFMNSLRTVESFRAFQIICDWQGHSR